MIYKDGDHLVSKLYPGVHHIIAKIGGEHNTIVFGKSSCSTQYLTLFSLSQWTPLSCITKLERLIYDI